MNKMSASQQKLLKVTHLIFAGIWFSSVILITLLPLVSKKFTTGDELYMITSSTISLICMFSHRLLL